MASGAAGQNLGYRIAAGQNLGYRIQDWRMLYHLLKGEADDSVFLEDIDDVHVEAESGYLTLEQDKSALTGNPLSNRSKDLWKTFYNWVTAVNSGSIDASKCSFVLFTLQKFDGEYADILENAKSSDELENALMKIQELISDNPTIVDDYIKEILQHKETLKIIIANFTLETWNNEPISMITDLLKSHPVKETHYETILNYLLGFIQNKITIKIKNKEIASINKAEFIIHYNKIRDNLSPNSILPDISSEIDPQQSDGILRNSLMIQQLTWIQVSDSRKHKATMEFLRASTMRTVWAEKEGIDDRDYEAFEADLVNQWELDLDEINIKYKASSDVDRGHLLHNACIKKKISLSGRETPSAFIPGSFYALSNRTELDCPKIGWHSDFKNLYKIWGK